MLLTVLFVVGSQNMCVLTIDHDNRCLWKGYAWVLDQLLHVVVDRLALWRLQINAVAVSALMTVTDQQIK
jgi:hypothetical protein